MIKEKRTFCAPYPAQQLFDMIQDVERYPDYVPYCVAIRVKERHSDHWIVDNHYRWGPISRTFRTRAEFFPPHEIHVLSQERGPFGLDVVWHFEAISNNKTRVSFEMSFQSDVRVLSRFVHKIVEEGADNLEKAFIKHTQDVL